MAQALRDGGVVVLRQQAALVERFARERDRGAVQAQARVDGAHSVHERRLDRRLRGELDIDTRGTLVENLARRDRVAERFARVGHLEEVDHEARRLLGGLGLRLRAHAFTLRLVPREPAATASPDVIVMPATEAVTSAMTGVAAGAPRAA